MMAFTPQQIAAIRHSRDLVGVVGGLVVLSKAGAMWRGLCPFHDEKTPSFYIKEQSYRCYGCGASGDVFAFVQATRGVGFVEAARILSDGSDLDLAAPDAVRREAERAQAAADARASRRAAWSTAEVARATKLLANSRSASSTPVEAYLARRGIRYDPRLHQALRYVPALGYWHQGEGAEAAEQIGCYPAMVAAMRDHDGQVAGIHITYLDPVTGGKLRLPDPDVPAEHGPRYLPSKKMRGRASGAAVRLAAADSSRVAIAEGIETGASVDQAMRATAGLWRPVWVAGSIGNICGTGLGRGEPHPSVPDTWLPSVEPDPLSPGLILPDTIRDVLILADADGKDPLADRARVQRAVNRWSAEGRRVAVAWPTRGRDFNDMLNGGPQ